MSQKNGEEEFQMTAEELKNIKQALKDKQFRDLLLEYANELSDPANKKKYEEEIIALEKQRGQDVKFVRPQAGFVVKTVRLSDNLKTFINICTSPEVDEYTEKKAKQNGNVGTHVSLPHSLTPCREDIDKAGKACSTYDVCFNPKSYNKALGDQRFRQLLIDTAFDGVEKQASVKFDRINKTFPKMKYKGVAHPSIIRSTASQNNNNFNDKSNSLNNNLGFQYPEKLKSKPAPDATVNGKNQNVEKSEIIDVGPTIPKYKMLHRGYFNMQDFTYSRTDSSSIPKEIIIEIELPLAKSSEGIDLDIFEKRLILDSVKPSYHLDINLSYKVNEDKGRAQFDKAKKVLTVTLPVLKTDIILPEVNKQPLVEEVTNCNDASSHKHINNNSRSDSPVPCGSNKLENVELESSTVINLLEEPKKAIDSSSEDTSEPATHTQTVTEAPTTDNEVETSKIDLDEIDLENVEFDTSILQSLPINSKLPPYSYDQTLEQIIVVIQVAGVKVDNLSLGFADQQVCISFPQGPEDALLADWNMIIRLEDDKYLNKDDCGFDISGESFELTLKKHEDCIGLWDRFYVGVSEIHLKAELFMTENIAKEMLKIIKSDSPSQANSSEDMFNKKLLDMEGRLQQLLKEQDDSTYTDMIGNDDKILEEINKQNLNKHEKSLSNESVDKDDCVFMQSEDDELSLVGKINLMDLQDDVIDENGSFMSPNSGSEDKGKKKSRFTSQRVYERSLSQDYVHHPRLKSILKRSKSDSSSWDTDEDISYSRMRATTLSYDTLYDSPKYDDSRRRHKSVTFHEKPIVFEFTKLSKRQWKRQIKEQKQREAMESKVKEMLKQHPVGKGQVTERTEVCTAAVKHGGKKWKKAERAKRRNNSESRSEEENEVVVERKKKSRPKKKKNKKSNQNIEHSNNTSSGPDSSSSERKPAGKVSLSNSLIFELE